MSGALAGWDYDWALNHSTNKVADRDVRGYLLYQELIDGIHKGLINVFGPSSAAGRDYLEKIQVNDEVRSAKGSMSSFDAKASRELMRLDGGALAIALGGELRREKVESRASELLLSDNINEDWTPGDSQFVKNSRKVWAAYGELNAPFTKQVELQLALRHDHYQKIGGSTNPKIGLRYQPSTDLLLRASAGPGLPCSVHERSLPSDQVRQYPGPARPGVLRRCQQRFWSLRQQLGYPDLLQSQPQT